MCVCVSHAVILFGSAKYLSQMFCFVFIILFSTYKLSSWATSLPTLSINTNTKLFFILPLSWIRTNIEVLIFHSPAFHQVDDESFTGKLDILFFEVLLKTSHLFFKYRWSLLSSNYLIIYYYLMMHTLDNLGQPSCSEKNQIWIRFLNYIWSHQKIGMAEKN